MTNRWLRRAGAWMAGLALVAIVGLAHAGPATDVAKAKQTALFELLQQTTPDAEKKRNAVYDELFDYKAMATASLGEEWAARSDAEKTQYTDLLQQLVRKAYERNLKKIVGYEVTYVGESTVSGGMMVKTTAKPKGSTADPIALDYKLVSTAGKWKCVDLTTDGVSAITSYRSQFTKIIKKDGFPALIQKMKDKLAKGDI